MLGYFQMQSVNRIRRIDEYVEYKTVKDCVKNIKKIKSNWILKDGDKCRLDRGQVYIVRKEKGRDKPFSLELTENNGTF